MPATNGGSARQRRRPPLIRPNAEVGTIQGDATASILIATDKFKGTFSSLEAGRAIAEGLALEGITSRVLAVADGGEGTADALRRSAGGSTHEAVVRDALARPVKATFTLIDDGTTAVVDAAQAIGLSRLAADELDPWNTSSAGVGDLIAAAAAAGAQHVIVAPGGTATVDGGQGAIATLLALCSVPRLRIACDVQTPWESAALTFGPQKGADDDTVRALSKRLDELALRLPKDPRGRPMTGCGGGLAGGLWASFSAELVEGAKLVLDAIRFDELLRDAQFVVTGEGQLDEQTGEGKLVAAVAARCRAADVVCVAVVGRNMLNLRQQQRLGLTQILQATTAAELRSAGRRLGALN